MPNKNKQSWEESSQKIIDYFFAKGVRVSKSDYDFISQEIAKAKQEERERILQIVIEDIPHQYQERLLTKLKEE
jgi:Zn-dependent M16 (insulinase) family peptidase